MCVCVCVDVDECLGEEYGSELGGGGGVCVVSRHAVSVRSVCVRVCGL